MGCILTATVCIMLTKSEQREARLEQIRVHGREIRASESSEQREARLEQIRVHGREIRE